MLFLWIVNFFLCDAMARRTFKDIKEDGPWQIFAFWAFWIVSESVHAYMVLTKLFPSA